MKIQKFLHSCLVTEIHGQRLVIDPGAWSSTPDIIGAVDVIIITHEHPDHFHLPSIKGLLALRKAIIVTNSSIKKLLTAEGIESMVLEGGQTETIGAFTIDAITAPHGNLPVPKPINVGYIINKTLFSPGDSFAFDVPNLPPVLALPITAPWGTTTEAVALGLKLKPKYIIPVHEQVYNQSFMPKIFVMCGELFKNAGIEFHVLKPGEELSV